MLLVAKINEPVSLLDNHMGGLVPYLLHQPSRDNPKMFFWKNLIFEISKNGIILRSFRTLTHTLYLSLREERVYQNLIGICGF